MGGGNWRSIKFPGSTLQHISDITVLCVLKTDSVVCRWEKFLIRNYNVTGVVLLFLSSFHLSSTEYSAFLSNHITL